MDYSWLPDYPQSPSRSGTPRLWRKPRLTPRQTRVLIDLACLVGIVALLVWARQTANALRQPPPPPPEPLPFQVVAKRFARVENGASRQQVERLLGPPTEGYAAGPEVKRFELVWWNGGRNFFPRDREWNRWTDPADPDRWVAVVYTGKFSEEQKVYGKLKKGF